MIDRVIRSKIQAVVICLILSTMFLSACSAFRSIFGKVKIKPPQVDFIGVKLTGLSFDALDFLFDLKVRNPNPLGVKLTGFDYDFMVDEISFLSGKQEKKLEIEAEGENTIQFPLSLRFVDLYHAFQKLQDQDNSMYRLNCVFSFDLPVLGLVRISVSKAGEFPLFKHPTVNLDTLQLKSLDLSGAELQLRVRLNNPNAFSMTIKHLQYYLEINGQRWISGDAKKNIQVTEKGESIIEIPISLDFFQIGQSVYQVLTGDKSLSYRFGGNLNLMTSIPLLGQVNLPFDSLGQIELIKSLSEKSYSPED